jgi:hypothetical protein
MPITYDITEDIRYQKGAEVARIETAKAQLRSPEFKRGAFDLNFIAITLGLPIERISALKAEIERGDQTGE